MYAIIPAAGHSRRMGQPKLLLPWDQGTILDCVLQTWLESQVEKVIVVARREDAELLEQLERHPVEIVTPDIAPPDMKQSILHGLEHIEAKYAPDANDAWLFAPADMPTLQRLVIDGLIAARREHALQRCHSRGLGALLDSSYSVVAGRVRQARVRERVHLAGHRREAVVGGATRRVCRVSGSRPESSRRSHHVGDRYT